MGNKNGQLRMIGIAGVSGESMSCIIKVVNVGLTQKVTLDTYKR